MVEGEGVEYILKHIDVLSNLDEDSIPAKLDSVLSIKEKIDEGCISAEKIREIALQLFTAIKSIIESVPPQFRNNAKHKLRSNCLEILLRIPSSSQTGSVLHASDVILLVLEVMEKDNEENALTALRLFIDTHKAHRPRLEGLIQKFFDLVLGLLRHLSVSIVKLLENENSVGHGFRRGSLSDTTLGRSTIAFSPSSSTDLVISENGGFEDDEHDDEPIVEAANSFKLLTECPVIVVLLFQMYSASAAPYVPIFVPNTLNFLNTQKPADSSSETAAYADYVAAKVKTLSFLAYLFRYHSEKLKPYNKTIPAFIVQLLKECPAESTSVRKELLIATRHLLSNEIVFTFTRYIDEILSIKLLIGGGKTSREALSPLAYSTLADIIHLLRAELSMQQLRRVTYIFCSNVHDKRLPFAVQNLSVKLLHTIIENIVKAAADDQEEMAGSLLYSILYTYIGKFSFLSIAAKGSKTKTRQSLVFTFEKEAKAMVKSLLSGLSATIWALINLRDGQRGGKQNQRLRIGNENILFKQLFKEGIQYFLSVGIHPSKPQNQVSDSGKPAKEAQGIGDTGSAGKVNMDSVFPKQSLEELKYLMEQFADIFTMLDNNAFSHIMEEHMSLLFDSILQNPSVILIPKYFLSSQKSARIFSVLLMPFLISRIPIFGDDSDGPNEALVFLSSTDSGMSALRRVALPFVPVLSFPNHEVGDSPGQRQRYRDIVLQLFRLVLHPSKVMIDALDAYFVPYIHHLMTECLHGAATALEPISYLKLLQSVFKMISGCKNEIIYAEFIRYVPEVLSIFQELAENYNCKGDSVRLTSDKAMELALSIPVRLSQLLPFFNQLLPILICTLKNSFPRRISQALRTLELFFDNIHLDFLENSIAPYKPVLLYLVRKNIHPDNPNATVAVRLIGKIGGMARVMFSSRHSNSNKHLLEDVNQGTIRSSWESCKLWESKTTHPIAHCTFAGTGSNVYPVELELGQCLHQVLTIVCAQSTQEDSDSQTDDQKGGRTARSGVGSSQGVGATTHVEGAEQPTGTHSAQGSEAAQHSYPQPLDNVSIFAAFEFLLGTFVYFVRRYRPGTPSSSKRHVDATDLERSVEPTLLGLFVCSQKIIDSDSPEENKEAVVNFLQDYVKFIIDLIPQAELLSTTASEDMTKITTSLVINPMIQFFAFDSEGRIALDVLKPLVVALSASIGQAEYEQLVLESKLADTLEETTRSSGSVKEAGGTPSYGMKCVEVFKYVVGRMCSIIRSRNLCVVEGAVSGMRFILDSFSTQFLLIKERGIIYSLLFAYMDIPLNSSHHLRVAIGDALFDLLRKCHMSINPSLRELETAQRHVVIEALCGVISSENVKLRSLARKSLTELALIVFHVEEMSEEEDINDEKERTDAKERGSADESSEIVQMDQDESEAEEGETRERVATLNDAMVKMLSQKRVVKILSQCAGEKLLRTKLPDYQSGVLDGITFGLSYSPPLVDLGSQSKFPALLEEVILIAEEQFTGDSFLNYGQPQKQQMGWQQQSQGQGQGQTKSHTPSPPSGSQKVGGKEQLQKGTAIAGGQVELGSTLALHTSLLNFLSAVLTNSSLRSSFELSDQRNKIISLLFKALSLRSATSVEIAKRTLAHIIKSNDLPKDLLQEALKPLLVSLHDHRKLSVQLLRTLAQLLELLNSCFSRTLGDKLLEHLKHVSDVILNSASFEGYQGAQGSAASESKTREQQLAESKMVSICVALLEIFPVLPEGAGEFLHQLVHIVYRLELLLPTSAVSPYRAPLFKYINRFAHESVKLFLPLLRSSEYSLLFHAAVENETSENLQRVLLDNPDDIVQLCFGVKATGDSEGRVDGMSNGLSNSHAGDSDGGFGSRSLFVAMKMKDESQRVSSAASEILYYDSMRLVHSLLKWEPNWFARQETSGLLQRLIKVWMVQNRTKRLMGGWRGATYSGAEYVNEESADSSHGGDIIVNAPTINAMGGLNIGGVGPRAGMEVADSGQRRIIKPRRSVDEMGHAIQAQLESSLILRVFLQYIRSTKKVSVIIFHMLGALGVRSNVDMTFLRSFFIEELPQLYTPEKHVEILSHAMALYKDVVVRNQMRILLLQYIAAPLLHHYIQQIQQDEGSSSLGISLVDDSVPSKKSDLHGGDLNEEEEIEEEEEGTHDEEMELHDDMKDDEHTGRYLLDEGGEKKKSEGAEDRENGIVGGAAQVLKSDLLQKIISTVVEDDYVVTDDEETLEDLNVQILQFLSILIRYAPSKSFKFKRQIVKFTRNVFQQKDIFCKNWTFVLYCRFIENFNAPQNLLLQLYIHLLREVHNETRQLANASLSILVPLLPKKIVTKEGEVPPWVMWTRKVTIEEGHSLVQIIHIWHVLYKFKDIFYPYRLLFVPHIVNSLPRIGLSSSSFGEQRALSVDLVDLILMWEKTARAEESSERLTSVTFGGIVLFLTRFLCPPVVLQQHVKQGKAGEQERKTEPATSRQQHPYLSSPLGRRAEKLLASVVSMWSEYEIPDQVIEYLSHSKTDLGDALRVVNVFLKEHGDRLRTRHFGVFVQLVKVFSLTVHPDVVSASSLIENVIEQLIVESDESRNREVAYMLEQNLQYCDRTNSPVVLAAISRMWRLDANSVSRLVPLLARLFQRLTMDATSKATTTQDRRSLLQCAEILSANLLTLGEQRKPYLSLIYHLLEKSNDSEIVKSLVLMIRDWIFRSDGESFLSVNEILKVVTKLAHVERFGNAKLDREYLQLLMDVITSERIALDQLEAPLLRGTNKFCHSDIRPRFFEIFCSLNSSPDVFSRLFHILLSQDWEPVSDSFWFANAVEYVLCSLKPEEVAMDVDGEGEAKEKEQEEEEGLLSKYKDHATAGGMIRPLIVLMHYSSRVCHDLWVTLFPNLWEVAPKAREYSISTALTSLVSKDYHSKLSNFRPNIVSTLLDGAAACIDREGARSYPPPITPVMLRYASKISYSWDASFRYLEYEARKEMVRARGSEKSGNEKQDEEADITELVGTTGTQELLRMTKSIGDEDMYLGILRQTINPRLKPIFTMFLSEMFSEAQDAAILEMLNASRLKEWELALLEEHWISSAVELNQWDIITEYAHSIKDTGLILQAAWQLGDWATLRSILSKEKVEEYASRAAAGGPVLGFETVLYKLGQVVQDGNLEEADRMASEASSMLIKEWNQLPARAEFENGKSNFRYPLFYSVNHSLRGLQVRMQQLIEIVESAPLLGILSGATRYNNVGSVDTIRTILGCWRERLPDISERPAVWSEILCWRHAALHSISTLFHSMQQAQSDNGRSEKATKPAKGRQAPTASGLNGTGEIHSTREVSYLQQISFHETAWTLNRFAHVAREHSMIDMCLSSLGKIYSLPNIVIQDAFIKLKEQVNCYFSLPHKNSRRTALDILNSTNLDFFRNHHKSHFLALKGEIYGEMGMTDDAHKAFTAGLTLNSSLGGGWARWGAFCAHLYEDSHQREMGSEAISCILQSLKHGSKKGMRLIPKLLWLMEHESDPQVKRSMVDVAREGIVGIPEGLWLPWTPFLVSLLDAEEESRFAEHVLTSLTAHYPHILYPALRTKRLRYQIRKGQSPSTNVVIEAQSDKMDSDDEVLHSCERLLTILWHTHLSVAYNWELFLSAVDGSIKTMPLELLYARLDALEDETSTTIFRAIEKGDRDLANYGLNEDIMGSLEAIYFQCFGEVAAEADEPFVTKYGDIFHRDFFLSSEGEDGDDKRTLAWVNSRLRLWLEETGSAVTALRRWRTHKESLEGSGGGPDFDQRLRKLTRSGVPLQLPILTASLDQLEENPHIVFLLTEIHLLERRRRATRLLVLYTSDGKRHSFAIEKASDKAGFSLSSEQLFQAINITNGYLSRYPSIIANYLHAYCPTVISVSPHTRLVSHQAGAFSLSAILEKHLKPNAKVWDACNAYNEALLQDKSSVSALQGVTDEMIPRNILSSILTGQFDSYMQFYWFRDLFTKLYALQCTLGYSLSMNDWSAKTLYIHPVSALPFRLGLDISYTIEGATPEDGKITVDKKDSEISKELKSMRLEKPGQVPFRLSPNIYNLLTPWGVAGPFSKAISSYCTCLKDPKLHFEHVLTLLFCCTVREDYPEIETPSEIVSHAAKEAMSRITSNSPSTTVGIITFNVDDLIEKAKSFENLSKMPPNWLPWF